LDPFGDVVGVEDGDLGCFGKSRGAHGGDIDPRDRKNAGAAPGRGGDGADGVLAAQVRHRVAGQEVHEMFGNTNGSHARPATAVRDAERFVQVQVANVRANVSRAAETDLRVHVRA